MKSDHSWTGLELFSCLYETICVERNQLNHHLIEQGSCRIYSYNKDSKDIRNIKN